MGPGSRVPPPIPVEGQGGLAEDRGLKGLPGSVSPAHRPKLSSLDQAL